MIALDKPQWKRLNSKKPATAVTLFTCNYGVVNKWIGALQKTIIYYPRQINKHLSIFIGNTIIIHCQITPQ